MRGALFFLFDRTAARASACRRWQVLCCRFQLESSWNGRCCSSRRHELQLIDCTLPVICKYCHWSRYCTSPDHRLIIALAKVIAINPYISRYIARAQKLLHLLPYNALINVIKILHFAREIIALLPLEILRFPSLVLHSHDCTESTQILHSCHLQLHQVPQIIAHWLHQILHIITTDYCTVVNCKTFLFLHICLWLKIIIKSCT